MQYCSKCVLPVIAATPGPTTAALETLPWRRRPAPHPPRMRDISALSGRECPMRRGDLILTPTGLWHEHGHDGTDPVVWLDVLDLPLVYYMEASYHINGERQQVKQGSGDRAWTRAGVAPTAVFTRSDKRYPMLRYPWEATRAALLGMAADQPDLECVQVTYVNPETGDDAENILGFYALMLKPGQTLKLPARSPSCVFHNIEGSADVTVEGTDQTFTLADFAGKTVYVEPMATWCTNCRQQLGNVTEAKAELEAMAVSPHGIRARILDHITDRGEVNS